MTVRVVWDTLDAGLRTLGWKPADPDAVPQAGRYRIRVRGVEEGDRRQGAIGVGQTRVWWRAEIDQLYPRTNDPTLERQIATDMETVIGKVVSLAIPGMDFDGGDIMRDGGVTTATTRWRFYGTA